MTQPNYSLSLTEQDLRIIAAALNDIPYRVAAPVMDKLKAQVEPQRAAAERSALHKDSNVGEPPLNVGFVKQPGD